jgi:hypothetical protein
MSNEWNGYSVKWARAISTIELIASLGKLILSHGSTPIYTTVTPKLMFLFSVSNMCTPHE